MDFVPVISTLAGGLLHPVIQKYDLLSVMVRSRS
jgi:hypothetical protein